jgi:hypothetical protein
MELLDIQFTPRTVKEIEQVSKKSIVELVGNYSMTTIFVLIQRGFRFDETQTEHWIEKYMEEQGDMFALYYELMEILLKKGLSPKGIAEEMPTMYQEAKWIKEKEAPLEDTSTKPGKKEKSSPSK